MGGRSSYKIRKCRFCGIETDSTNICYSCFYKGLRLRDLKKVLK